LIRILMGNKGTGKTKTLIEWVNAAINEENGNVVCINKGNRFMYDFNHAVRLINTEDFRLTNFEVFRGFLCGIISEDYDITHIFIDSILKIVPETAEALDKFIAELETLSSQFNIKFSFTISEDTSSATDNVRKYIIA